MLTYRSSALGGGLAAEPATGRSMLDLPHERMPFDLQCRRDLEDHEQGTLAFAAFNAAAGG
jgi:hypothetical protein